MIDQFHHPDDPAMLILSLVVTQGKPTGRRAAHDHPPAAMKQRIDPLVAVQHFGKCTDPNDASRTAASVLTDEL